MKSTTRKHIWPVSLVMTLVVVGMVVALVALAVVPQGTSAQAPPPPPPPPTGTTPPTGSDGVPTPPAPPTAPVSDKIESTSTSGGASVQLELTIGSLPMGAVAGSSVELYLEDDFQVPDSIARNTVYFTVPGGDENQNGGGRVYSADPVEIDDDDHFGGDDDWSIRVFIPDMNDADNTGYDGPTAGQTVNLVFTKDSGIKNPTEAGSHSVGYSVLGPNAEANDGPTVKLDDAAGSGAPLVTAAKISLSDEKGGRGKEVTITGTGFNNGVGAEAFVLIKKTGDAPSCMDVVNNGESLGEAEVGLDDKFVITFAVHQDDFDPGVVNYICAADAESGDPRFASAVKTFDLEPSVSVSPSEASYGDEVTVKPRDFGSGGVVEITVGPDKKWTAASGDTDAFAVEPDGSDYVFDLPGGLGRSVQIAVKGVDPKDSTKTVRKTATLGVSASGLTLSQTEVAPNESIIISGNGFNESTQILASKITIDGKALYIDDAGTQRNTAGNRYLTTTSNGTFTVTARAWSTDPDTNPALDDDEYTIKVVDQKGFEGKATITINEPTISVSPEIASPRDFIVISGENWPVTTADLDNEVEITLHKGETYQRKRSANVDGNGRFRYEYQLPANVRIGDEQKVEVRFDGDGSSGNIEEDTTFEVTDAGLGLTPAAAAPGQTVSVEIEGMPPYTLVEHVNIDGANRLGGRNVNTDREGNATVSDILVPFLDPGHYPVEVKVGNETRVAQLEVLAEAAVGGVASDLPDAVSDIGDNLDAIFHFNNTSKEWTFYDPRPEFTDLNTLNELHGGQPYWVLVKDSQEDVDWNGRLVSFTCAAGDCWNLEIW